MLSTTKTLLRSHLPRPVYEGLRLVKKPSDMASTMRFLRNSNLGLPLRHRLDMVWRMFSTTFCVDCPHTQEEILAFIEVILRLPAATPGAVVEAGCYKGGSTAKFSFAAWLAHRKLIVFDSFEGIPRHEERHSQNIFGGEAEFAPGSYAGSLNEVKRNVARFGTVEVCTFVKGWFENTLPSFREPVAAAYLDVDLASSTRTCIKHLYPLIIPGGVLLSHDGHLPLVLDVFRDDAFWESEVGCPRPVVAGIGSSKLLMIEKSRVQ